LPSEAFRGVGDAGILLNLFKNLWNAQGCVGVLLGYLLRLVSVFFQSRVSLAAQLLAAAGCSRRRSSADCAIGISGWRRNDRGAEPYLSWPVRPVCALAGCPSLHGHMQLETIKLSLRTCQLYSPRLVRYGLFVSSKEADRFFRGWTGVRTRDRAVTRPRECKQFAASFTASSLAAGAKQSLPPCRPLANPSGLRRQE